MKEKIIKFLEESTKKAYQNKDMSMTYYLDLENGYSIVLTWEDGFEDYEDFITYEGNMLCVSLRVTDSSCFVFDWYMVDGDICLEEGKINYELVVSYLLDMLK